KQTRGLIEGDGPLGRHPLTLQASGADGSALVVAARVGAHRAQVQSETLLTPARKGGLDAALLRDKLGALGGTLFHLAGLDVSGLPEGLHLPVSELKTLRRELVDQLTGALGTVSDREVRQEPVLEALR